MDLLNVVLSDAALPFTTALVIFFAVGTIQTIGMMLGFDASSSVDDLFDIDADADVDIDTDMDVGDVDFVNGALSWLGVGKVPLMVILMSFNLLFGTIGTVIQFFAHDILGTALPLMGAVPLAIVGALFLNSYVTRFFARILPKEETYVVSADGFVGKTAVITIGTARFNLPAEARLKDIYGTTHYVRVRPKDSTVEFPAGTEILLLEKDGNVFTATSYLPSGT